MEKYICDRISKTRICESFVALDIRQLGGILGNEMEARGCKDQKEFREVVEYFLLEIFVGPGAW